MSNVAMTTTVPGPFDQAKARVTEALAAEGFGVLTQIDMRATLAAKIGAQVEPYEILGACNPGLAHQALEADRSVGLLLPCNVTLREVAGGVEVAILDPRAMFGVADEALQERLSGLVEEARSRLTRALEALG